MNLSQREDEAMQKWLRRVRGAVGMGVVWALVWAPIAVLISFIVDRDGSMDEPWPLVGAIPGFIGGVVFSIVLASAARQRRLEELSMGRVAAWGATAGFMVGSLPFIIGDAASGRSPWLLGTIVIGSITIMSAASAAASLALARRGTQVDALGAGGDRAAAALGEGETRVPLGQRMDTRVR